MYNLAVDKRFHTIEEGEFLSQLLTISVGVFVGLNQAMKGMPLLVKCLQCHEAQLGNVGRLGWAGLWALLNSLTLLRIEAKSIF